MTNPNYTHIAVVLDRSGSMATIKNDMVKGLNSFFEEQAKLPGHCEVDLIQFDNEYEVVFSDRHISKAKAELHPRGSTALLDAIGKTVTDLGKKLRDKAEDERPGTVMVIVVTDGYENASREWTKENIRKVIKTQTDEFNWDFVFMGTNFDAVSAGRDFGFSGDKSLTFNAANVAAATGTLNTYTSNYRTSGKSEFTEADRLANK